jgi:transcriptional regulator with XRE-family HTH domain
MHHDSNVIGPTIVKLRYQRDWTQDDLVGKLLFVGCYMTRCILANIETRRCIVTDKQIEYFAAVFGVGVGNLFPPSPRTNGEAHDHLTDITSLYVTRHRHRKRRCGAHV